MLRADKITDYNLMLHLEKTHKVFLYFLRQKFWKEAQILIRLTQIWLCPWQGSFFLCPFCNAPRFGSKHLSAYLCSLLTQVPYRFQQFINHSQNCFQILKTLRYKIWASHFALCLLYNNKWNSIWYFWDFCNFYMTLVLRIIFFFLKKQVLYKA